MSTPNPYSSPDTAIADHGRPWDRDVPEEVESHIKNGWVAALVSMVMTLGMTVFAMFKADADVAMEALGFIDVGLIGLLAFGIYKRSRTAATLMLLYFVVSKILEMVAAGMPTGLLFGMLFAYFYFRAMVATFGYHRFVKDWKRNPPVPKARLSDDPLFATQNPTP